MFPGALPMIKYNLFNVVLVLDLSQTVSLNFIAGPVSNILSRDIPLRFGLVPAAETEDGLSLLLILYFSLNVSIGKKMANLFYYLIKSYGRKKTLEFVKNVCINCDLSDLILTVRGTDISNPDSRPLPNSKG